MFISDTRSRHKTNIEKKKMLNDRRQCWNFMMNIIATPSPDCQYSQQSQLACMFIQDKYQYTIFTAVSSLPAPYLFYIKCHISVQIPRCARGLHPKVLLKWQMHIISGLSQDNTSQYSQQPVCKGLNQHVLFIKWHIAVQIPKCARKGTSKGAQMAANWCTGM